MYRPINPQIFHWEPLLDSAMQIGCLTKYLAQGWFSFWSWYVFEDQYTKMKYSLRKIHFIPLFNPILHEGGGQNVPAHVDNLWILSGYPNISYFMSLFFSTFYRSHWSHFSKKNFKISKKKKKEISLVQNQRVPPLEKMEWNRKKIFFFKKIVLFQAESEFYMF